MSILREEFIKMFTLYVSLIILCCFFSFPELPFFFMQSCLWHCKVLTEILIACLIFFFFCRCKMLYALLKKIKSYFLYFSRFKKYS